MFLMNTIFYSRINSKFGLHNLFVCAVEEDMGHCVGWMEVQILCTLVFISILYMTNDNYYCHTIRYLCINSKLCLVVYNNFTFGPIEDIRWSNRGNRGHDWTDL